MLTHWSPLSQTDHASDPPPARRMPAFCPRPMAFTSPPQAPMVQATPELPADITDAAANTE